MEVMLAFGADTNVKSSVCILDIGYWILDCYMLYSLQVYHEQQIKHYHYGTFNIQNDETPLHSAAKYGRNETAKVSIKHGAQIDARTKVSNKKW